MEDTQKVLQWAGWISLVNRQPDFDGVELLDNLDKNGELVSITCKIYHKNKRMPTTITEYMAECRRNTDPWVKWPRRMLRHKAYIQCARVAFGFSGIYDKDETDETAPIITTRRSLILKKALLFLIEKWKKLKKIINS